jgi:broad specificity phosphatase PhoE
MKITFETHSTSVDNERGVASGHLDPELSEEGRRQAAVLGLRYSDRDLSVVYTSDLQRSVATAGIAFRTRVMPQKQDLRLREWNYGRWSGRSTSEVDMIRAQCIDQPFPEGEGLRDVVRRTAEFLNDLTRGKTEILVIGYRATWYGLGASTPGPQAD